MHNHTNVKPLPHLKKAVLIGNPNVGKSLIFGCLTGRYVTVSNYPGTTVEITLGDMKIGSEIISLIDTPGINSLTPISEDERVVRDILLKENITSVIQVVDAKNLERGLYITTQTAEMGLPTLIVLNMMDEAQTRGVDINIAELSRRLGVPIVPTVATQRKGIERIKKELPNSSIPRVRVSYSQTVEESLEEIEKIIPTPHFSRFIGLSILSGDGNLNEDLISRVPKNKLSSLAQLHHFSQISSKEYPISYFIGLKRLELAKNITQKVSATSFKSGSRILETLGWISIHPVFGIPILVSALYVAWLFVGKLGAGVFVDFLEGTIFEGYINPFFKIVIPKIIPINLLSDFLVGDFGVITMALTYSLAIIFPVICTFFIFFSLLEDSGYLPRLAIMVDRVFKLMGLNGKVIIKTLARLEWYLKEAVPIFILGTIILFILDRLKVLEFIQNLASPVVVKFLNLPKEATNAFLIGFLRRDYGAAGLFDLQQKGHLNNHQVLVSLVTITLFVPCIASFLIIIKEQGLRTALIIAGIVLFLALLIGGMTNWILGSLGI